jgi:hypothetical protein
LKLGLALWCEDEAGPYQTVPQPGESWQLQGQPLCQSHEYVRNGTAKLLTLFQPATGKVGVKGVTSTKNAVLHPWLKEALATLVASLPPAPALDPEANRMLWTYWQEGLQEKFTLLTELPPLKMLLVLDNLAGHKSADLVCWLMEHGVMPIYTPVGRSWLNMAESIQRILTRCALAGQHPQSPQDIITWLEATASAWNRKPTPFIWGGKRKARRDRAKERRHRLGGSGACTLQPISTLELPQHQRLCA